MPRVNGKEFPYTAKGIKDAKKAKDLDSRKKKMESMLNNMQDPLSYVKPKKKPVPMPKGSGAGKAKPMPKGLAKPATKGPVRIPSAIVPKPAKKGGPKTAKRPAYRSK